MNAKKLLSILAFTLLFCTLLTAFALADSKVIRFDGDSNITATSSAGNVTEDGYLHVTKPVSGDSRFSLTLTGDEFTLYDYPYIKIKFRTNHPVTTQVYFDKSSHYYTEINKATGASFVSTDGTWHTAEISYDRNGTTISDTEYSVPFTNEDGIKRDAKRVQAAAVLPNPDKKVTVGPMLILPRNATATGYDFYIDIEYIAFFTTKEEMQSYDVFDAKILSFDENSTVSFSIPNQNIYSFNDNGVDVGKISLIDGQAQGGNVTLKIADADHFLLNDYPYVALKLKTDLPVNDSSKKLDTQLYMDDFVYTSANSTATTSYGHYVCYLENSTPALTPNVYFTTELYYPKDGSSQDYSYTSSDGRKNSVGFANFGEGEIKKFPDNNPNSLKEVVVKSPFFQFKGADVEAGKTVHLDYVAYFANEADMKTYVADHNSVTAAMMVIAAGDYSAKLHQAAAFDYVYMEDQIKATIISALGDTDVDVAVNITSYTRGSTSTTANVIVQKGEVKKSTDIDVAVTDFGNFKLETLGAQVRTDANNNAVNDLRFGFKIDTVNTPENCTIVEFGTVIGKANSKPTYNGNGFATVKAENIFKNENGIKTFTAVVTKIPDGTGDVANQYTTNIVARPYLIYSYEGKNFTVYGTSISRNVQQVIDAALTDGNWHTN